MVHLKAVRLFVEGALRYGVPCNFQAVLLKPKKEVPLRKVRLAHPRPRPQRPAHPTPARAAPRRAARGLARSRVCAPPARAIFTRHAPPSPARPPAPLARTAFSALFVCV